MGYRKAGKTSKPKGMMKKAASRKGTKLKSKGLSKQMGTGKTCRKRK